MTEILKRGGYLMNNLKLNILKNNLTLSNSVLFWWWPQRFVESYMMIQTYFSMAKNLK